MRAAHVVIPHYSRGSSERMAGEAGPPRKRNSHEWSSSFTTMHAATDVVKAYYHYVCYGILAVVLTTMVVAVTI